MGGKLRYITVMVRIRLSYQMTVGTIGNYCYLFCKVEIHLFCIVCFYLSQHAYTYL